MLPTLVLVLHLLGSAVWLGGHIVLVRVILPAARKAGDAGAVKSFERAYGRLGMAALLIQVSTGAWLAAPYIGGWSEILTTSTPARTLILGKLVLLAMILVLAAHASHRILPRLRAETLGAFAVHAWVVTILSAALVVLGAGIRTGGLV